MEPNHFRRPKNTNRRRHLMGHRPAVLNSAVHRNNMYYDYKASLQIQIQIQDVFMMFLEGSKRHDSSMSEERTVKIVKNVSQECGWWCLQHTLIEHRGIVMTWFISH